MREPRSYATQSIILKHADLGEADRIVTLLTPYRGKLHVVAKGARRPISKKAGHIDLLSHCQLHIASGRNMDLITQAEGIESFLHLRTELWHMTCGFYLSELVDRFLEEHTIHQDVYQLFLEALRSLDRDALTVCQQRAARQLDTNQEHGRTQLLLRSFEMNLLSYIGYEPVFRTCAHCATELQAVENGFTPALGGALCPNCSHLWAHPLSVNALKVLRILQRTAWASVPIFRLDARLHIEMELAMHGLLRYHLERDLKSWSFLEMLR